MFANTERCLLEARQSTCISLCWWTCHMIRLFLSAKPRENGKNQLVSCTCKTVNYSLTCLATRKHLLKSQTQVSLCWCCVCVLIENIDSCGMYTQHQDRARLKPHLHALKRSVLHAKFLTPCRDYLREECWCHITCGTDTFTRRKLGALCLKIVSTVPKIWRALPIFLGHVNGVSVCLATRKHLLSHERVSLPLKKHNDLWT